MKNGETEEKRNNQHRIALRRPEDTPNRVAVVAIVRVIRIRTCRVGV